MVVLKPMLRGERERTCRWCGHMGICSPIRERSCWYLKTAKGMEGRTPLFQNRCRFCRDTPETREAKRAAYAVRRAAITDEQLAAQRARWRSQKRNSLDAEGERERRAAASLRSYSKRRANLGEAFLENRRIDHVCRLERRGLLKLKSVDEVKNFTGRTHEMLPAEPFRRWLVQRISLAMRENGVREKLARSIVAQDLQTSVRRLYEWTQESMVGVDWFAVDRCVSRHGAVTVADVYRLYLNGEIKARGGKGAFAFVVYHPDPVRIAMEQGTEEEEIEKEEKVYVAQEPTRCRSQGCRDEAANGSRFCGTHTAVLAKVREDLKNDAAAFRSTIKKKNMRSTCCNPSCREPRLPTHRYCGECEAAGWDEDDIE